MMKKWENYDHKNPSFSSSLLDEIYRSIDDGEKKSAGEMRFYRDSATTSATARKQIRNRAFEDREMVNLRRACLIEKWMEKKVGEKADVYRRQEIYRKSHLDYDHDRDALFFSSTSSSSDSSSGGLSSSDTESMLGARSLKPSCFASSRLKAIRTGTGRKTTETERTKKSLFNGKCESHVFDDYSPTLKSKPSELKKVKQPISPGVRLAGLLNSLFTAGNSRKSKNSPAADRKSKAGEESSACSSASSFARSCLSKNSASSREKLGNGAKRTVRFCPISVILDEEDGSSLMPVSIPTAWKIGRSRARKYEDKDVKSQITEKSRKAEDAARELLKKNLNTRNYQDLVDDDDGDGFDDGASCSSSDLFELDHLEMIGQRRYSQELPVYETTHVEKNRAISKALLLPS